jgi:hypothetical protein
MNDYSKHCPKDGDIEQFNRQSNEIVANYFQEPELRSQEDINSELRNLRKVLSRLSNDTCELIFKRESMGLGIPLPAEPALERLKHLVEKDLGRFNRKDAHPTFQLIQSAAICFYECGGEVTPRINGPFVKFVHHLSEDIGLEIDAPSAIRNFLEKTK